MKQFPFCNIADASDMKEHLIAVYWWLRRLDQQKKQEFERLCIIYRAPHVSIERVDAVIAERHCAAAEWAWSQQ